MQPMDLDAELLDSPELNVPGEFSACINAHGLYHFRQFVLRLSPRVHELVDGLTSKKVVSANEVSDEGLQAYSTYLHETIHWWQHKGSISGFVKSMQYPAQTHGNMQSLKDLTALIGPKKSLISWTEKALVEALKPSRQVEYLSNTIVNNFLDTEFFVGITYTPELARKINEERYFECAGHSFHMAYAQVMHVLSQNVDQLGEFLPDTQEWEQTFLELRNQEILGHYYGSPVRLPPVGVLEILEGQARFVQLQFLRFAKDSFNLEAATAKGMLRGVYGKAFETFLKMTDSVQPEDIDDPLVALFLLVCDLSLNPTCGFPDPIVDFDEFYADADPGIRFAFLCDAIADELPELKTFIQNYSREEYIFVATALSDACGYGNPIHALEGIASWRGKSDSIRKLMEEHRTFEFGGPNLAVRVLLSEFVAFNEDKLRRPDFFCWPGFWMTGSSFDDEEVDLWLNHLSLYSDKKDDDGIFPRAVRGRDLDAVKRSFNQFYIDIMMYDVTKQWVLQTGPFDLSFRWLTLKIPEDELAASVKKIFEMHYGFKVDDFELLDKVL